MPDNELGLNWVEQTVMQACPRQADTVQQEQASLETVEQAAALPQALEQNLLSTEAKALETLEVGAAQKTMAASAEVVAAEVYLPEAAEDTQAAAMVTGVVNKPAAVVAVITQVLIK